MGTTQLLGRLGRLVGMVVLLSGLAHAGPVSTPGQFDVSPTGAATYSIPISIPPGIAGIEPKLALSYNSQTGNGLLGVGWSLSGLSAITRCARTVAQDGVKGGINFDANDRYCLDGQRLMAISGTYGAANTEYRTERESFSRIVSYGTAGTGGAAWFKVWTKAGQVIEYGNTADSRIEAKGRPSVRVWAINKISDTKGNYLTFSYTEDTVNGDYYPSSIDYTGNGAQPSNNSVRFFYETRPDSVSQYYFCCLVKSTRRLKTVQAFSGSTPIREYRLTYTLGAATNRSRIATVTECALPSNTCKPTLTFSPTGYGSNTFNAGSSWTTLAGGFLADVDGDGRADFIAQQSDGLYVALSTGTGAGTSSKWIGSFGYSQGYSDQGATPIFLIDVNGDGLADAVGFASDGVYVALSNGAGFNVPIKWINDFGTGNGWSTMDTYPRTFADANGDGRPDIVGFKNDGVYVALNTGTGFDTAAKWTGDFGTASTTAYGTYAANPRLVQDMNGDGLPDIVGFANDGVYVALNTGTFVADIGFAPAALKLADFGVTAGYGTQDSYPRSLADVNGDGLPDIVGFKSDGVYVSINTGSGLQTASMWLSDYGTATATAYSSQKDFPRYLADVNGDGKADIVGFAANGVQVAIGTGTGFNPSTQWVDGFGSAAGYTAGMPRQLADVDGDGFPDVVGTLASGTSVARTARTTPADLVTGIDNGLGVATTLSYDVLTTPSVYTKGTGSVYPQMDLTIPLYVVSLARFPNALGAGYTMSYYQYGGLKADLRGRGLLGFGWQQALQVDSNITSRTNFRQDWPYQGLPADTTKTLHGAGNRGLLSLVVNTYSCAIPETDPLVACPVPPEAGNRYFPYVSQTVEAGWDTSHFALPVVATSNTFDGYGNAKVITVSTDDGTTKTTTNDYDNTIVNTPDAEKWHLGRLTRSKVTSEVTGVPVANMSNGAFVFNDTISTDTANYNLKAAAMAKAIADNKDPNVPILATVTINAGVTVYSTTTTISAFDTGSNLPAGSVLTLVNNGMIVGKGGSGGQGYGNGLFCSYYGGCSVGTVGGDGGPALGSGALLTVTNNGTIAGGGGGGGGGSYAFNNYYFQNYAASGGGGGGGGAGQGTGGLAGIVANGSPSAVNGNAGNAGALTTPGDGGAGNISYNNAGSDPGSYVIGGTGGAGGGPGQPGAAGANGSAQYVGPTQSGGAAGPAVTGNINVTWLSTGTLLGALVPGSSAPLTVTGISPNAGPVVGGTLVTLTGTGFVPGATAGIGAAPAVGCSVISGTQITCLTPAGSVGAKDVVVTSGGGTATLANGFTYQALTVTAVSPNIGSFAGGTSILVSGTGFAPGARISIGGVAMVACAVIGSTTMTCITPPNSAGIKNVVVGLDETTATMTNGFTYQGLSVTAISPNTGSTSGGTAITLTGTGFQTGAAVTIGGAAATGCTASSLTRMTCTTAANGMGSQDVIVSLGGSTATLAGGFSYLFNPIISASTANYNLKAAAIAAGWDQIAPLVTTVTINGGIFVSSSSTVTPAFDTGSGYPAGSQLTLINNGYIVGKGGDGGAGGNTTDSGAGAGQAGSPGGPALQASVAITIRNNYRIAGGGGGGGGGGAIVIRQTSVTPNKYVACAGGGGGGGKSGGQGGAGGTAQAYNSSSGLLTDLRNGTPGTSGSSVDGQTGSGGAGGTGGCTGGAGGTGGGYNSASIAGSAPSGINPVSTGIPGAAGAKGAAVIGNSNVTWAATGTRYGALQ